MVAFALASLEIEEFQVPSSDGESSIYIKRYVRGTGKLHFFLVHGAIEYSGRHLDQVNFWMGQYADVSVTIFDHIGHGKSGGTQAYVNNFKDYVLDFILVEEFIEKRLGPGTATFICAHSLGGLIALTRILDTSFVKCKEYAGLIFSSPCIKPRIMWAPFSGPILEKMDKLTPKFHLPLIYHGQDLTRDNERANDFNIDPLIPKFMSVRMAREIILASEKIRGQPYYLRFPTLFLIAGSDKLVDPVATTLFAHGVDKQLVEVIQYQEHYHELWNEIDRQNIFGTMKKWVDKLLKESQ